MCTRGKINKHAGRNFGEMFFYFLTSQPVITLNSIIAENKIAPSYKVSEYVKKSTKNGKY